MHTFEPKQKPGYQAYSAGYKAQCQGSLAPHHEVGAIPSWQRTIGNRAVQRLIETNPESIAGSTAPARFAQDFRCVNSSVPDGAPAVRTIGNDAAAPPSIGEPLDADIRARYELGLGTSLTDVRIHADVQSAASADALHAEAYTIGHEIVFGAGRYQPRSLVGSRLLAHELAHVVQQRPDKPAGSLLAVSKPGDPSERVADHAADALLAGRHARLAPGSEPLAIHRQAVVDQSRAASGADATALVRAWLEQHQFAPPEQQPDEGEQHVLLNGEDMTLSQAVQLAVDDQALHQPAEVVKAVLVAALARPRPFPGSLLGAPILGPGNLVPGIPSSVLGPTPTGGIDPVIGKMVDLGTIDDWLQSHHFSPPEIRDPLGDRVVLDGHDTTIEEVADRAWAIVGGAGPIWVAFVTRQEILVHLRQKYVAARGGPSTQIVLGYTLVPQATQFAPSDPNNPLRTQHQFSFTITRQHHAGDSPGLETSFQGSVTINDAGEPVNIQAGGQEAIVAPLLRGWIQVSGFAQVMASANWSRSASGSLTVSPAVQASLGGQILLTPNLRGVTPVTILDGHVQVGGPQLGVQVLGGLQASSQGVQPGASIGLVLNLPFSLL